VPQLFSLGLDPDELIRRLRAGIKLPAEYDWVEADPIP
jgi:hypothetical protein